MNATPSDSDSNAILDRLLSGAGLHRDAQLASLLGVSPQAVSQARRKRRISRGPGGAGWRNSATFPWGAGSCSARKRPGRRPPPRRRPRPRRRARRFPILTFCASRWWPRAFRRARAACKQKGKCSIISAFRSEWLCRKGNPDRMVLMKVYGDSMEPEIRHGDMALIDQSKQQIYPHTIYAVGVNEDD